MKNVSGSLDYCGGKRPFQTSKIRFWNRYISSEFLNAIREAQIASHQFLFRFIQFFYYCSTFCLLFSTVFSLSLHFLSFIVFISSQSFQLPWIFELFSSISKLSKRKAHIEDPRCDLHFLKASLSSPFCRIGIPKTVNTIKQSSMDPSTEFSFLRSLHLKYQYIQLWKFYLILHASYQQTNKLCFDFFAPNEQNIKLSLHNTSFNLLIHYRYGEFGWLSFEIYVKNIKICNKCNTYRRTLLCFNFCLLVSKFFA